MKFNIDSLDRSFVIEYNRLQNAYPERLSELNGFGDKQLNYTDFIDNFVDKQTIADASIDGNANVAHKDIVSLINEMSKPHSKLLAFNKIFHELTKKYGHEDATEWLKGEWDGHFYLHDAHSSSWVPYCFAYDIDELVKRGLYFIDNFNAAPPQHLNTYTDFVSEFVSWTCNRSSGAVGLPSFLVYSYYFWKKDCDEGYFVKSPEYYRDQSFQEIIYRLNQPYLRGGIQSAFTNFSIFDKPYLEALKGRVITCAKTLDVIRDIMKRNTEKGLLPNYALGIINMKSQYNTVGIIGVYEALQKFGYTYHDEFGNTYYKDKGVEFAKKILATITETKDEFVKDKDYMMNIEQVPGERAAAVLMEKDKLFFPDEKYDLPLYGNQWIPLGIKTTIAEKVRVSAILDKACSGGSIVHLGLAAPFSDFDEAWYMMNYVADAGVNYFAFNLRISACDNNHGFFGDTCPECGHPVETTYQRIVGFLTPTKTYSEARKKEFAMRDWFDLNNIGEL